jgi:single-stranded-DNA-specific exonuclease
MEIAGLGNKPQLDAEDIGFALGPRLNASGRLGQAQLAVELLTTDRPDRARELAQYLNGLNESRQTLERSAYQSAHKQSKERFDPEHDTALVLADRDWHPGVIGIVAGRLAEKYHLPVVLVAWDRLGIKPGVGSARSIPGFDLHQALRACRDHLVSHGGHAAAAGLKIHEQQIDAFRCAFCEYAGVHITEEERVAEISIDAEAPLSAFTLKVASQLERLAPFGQHNDRPLLCATRVRLAGPPKQIGNGGRHLSVELSQHDLKMRAIAFGGGEWADELSRLDGPVDVAFRPIINTFRGRRSVELQLVDWRASAANR